MRYLICLILLTGCDYVIPVRPVREHKDEAWFFESRVAQVRGIEPNIIHIDTVYKSVVSGPIAYKYDRIHVGKITVAGEVKQYVFFTSSSNGQLVQLFGDIKIHE